MEVYLCIESREVSYHNHQRIDYDPAALSDDEDSTLFSVGSYGGALAWEGGLEQQDVATVGVRGARQRPRAHQPTRANVTAGTYNASCATHSTMGTWRATMCTSGR
jgi:hypothetical protein